MKAICHKNGGTCPYFTESKVYAVRTPYISRRIGEVTDDHGNSRLIPIDGSLCAHIIVQRSSARYTSRHECVGTWEVIE